jgi:eukaryotic-like serine/threonine-protein kinase
MSLQYGRYRIVKELGKGTMGVVYQAHDPQIDRMVALKVLRPDRVTSEAFVARFLKEARAIGRLSHPHIVTIFDAGEDQGTIYIAMEYLEGEPFNEVIRSGRLTVPQCVELARQIAATLDYAHRQGIVHRDIKPSNIILDKDNQVKLTDFGIARIEEAASGQQTQAGEILGTPVYMSPEQVMGQTVDGRSDLFSVGVILYEMIVGHRPFSGNNIAAIFRAITQDVPEPPADTDPFIPKELSDLIMKSLAKQLGERFQTGAQMAEALNAVLPEAQAQVDPGPPAPQKSKVKMVAALAVLLSLSLGVGGYFILGQRAADGTGIGAAAIPPDQLATLKINSDPAGAQVFVDNGLRGRTPLDVPLPVGKYELRLSLPGYLEWQAQVNLDETGDTPLNVTMWPLE